MVNQELAVKADTEVPVTNGNLVEPIAIILALE